MREITPLAERPPLARILNAQANVLAALMLRDIKTRFGSAPGFLLAIAWPLSHILILVGINIIAGRVVPYGESATLWFAVSMTPFMIVSYTSRFMMIGLVTNRPLLVFPIISVFDILLSRILIEIIVAACVLACLVVMFVALDVDFVPIDISRAVSGLAVSLFLGIGLGILNSIIAMIVHQWMTIYALSTILLWMTSGAYFVPSMLDASVQQYLFYHPIMHCIEWTREGYFSGYHSLLLDKSYVWAWALGTIFTGLLIERLLRGRVLLA